jgi:CO/xanthine dehydrogenase FAD-binding subunit
MPLAVRRVDSVRGAAALLAADSGARFLAGGTLLVRNATAGDVSIETLVLCDGLGLDRIAIAGGRAEIGAAVTMAQVAAHRDLAFLAPVAESIGGPAVRNMATVGGNLFAPYPYGDFAVALLALGASVTVEDASGPQTEDLEAFLARGARGAGGAGVVTSFAFTLPAAGAFRFVKAIRRKPHGASVLAIAAVLPVASGRIAGARVAYGAMAATPMRARTVEAALEGKALAAASINDAVAVATEGCKPMSDPQASAWYRLQVLPVHLRRLLSGEAA